MSASIVEGSTLFSYENFVYATAGSAGSVFSMALLYPLDIVRSILQIEDQRKSKHSFGMIIEIIREDGPSRLYRGLQSVLFTLCVSNFIYFYCYHGLKGMIVGQASQSSGFYDLICAFIAGSINVLCTTPLWVVNIRMKFQGANVKASWFESKQQKQFTGVLGCLTNTHGLIQIASREGISALWNGTLPSLLLVLNPSLHFMIYEIQKRYAQSALNVKELPGLFYFIFGAIAKAIATLLTYPLQLVQARFRYKNKSHRLENIRNPIVKSFVMITNIIRVQGFLGLYKGLEAKLLQTILNAAVMFFCYEEIAAIVFRLMGVEFSAGVKTTRQK